MACLGPHMATPFVDSGPKVSDELQHGNSTISGANPGGPHQEAGTRSKAAQLAAVHKHASGTKHVI
jgi:hypothetical protein